LSGDGLYLLAIVTRNIMHDKVVEGSTPRRSNVSILDELFT